ncbi:MAG: hypothetical protein IKW81_07145 [Pseudobutyrivibrio sp.]|nr:hypothetical protein [Pseudobutyrivibrio sp.]
MKKFNRLDTQGFSTRIKKIYVKEDNSLNRVSLFLSALALALIILLLMHFKGLSFVGSTSARELTVEEATQELYEYINSLNGFTDAQRDVLNSVISNYLSDKAVLTDEDMNTMYEVINNKYQSNKSYVESIKNELVKELSSNVNSDQKNYEELNTLIQNLDTWLSETNNTQESNAKTFNSLLEDLRSYTQSSDTQLNMLINDLSATMAAEDDILREEIDYLKERTIDNDIPFFFGFKDGLYGYYVDEEIFKPF